MRQLSDLPNRVRIESVYPPGGGNRYWRVSIRPHPWFPNPTGIRRSLVVWVANTGSFPMKGYHIHHKDGDRDNDAFENLEILTPAEHNRLHKTGAKHSSEAKAKIAAGLRKAYAEKRRVAVWEQRVRDAEGRFV